MDFSKSRGRDAGVATYSSTTRRSFGMKRCAATRLTSRVRSRRNAVMVDLSRVGLRKVGDRDAGVVLRTFGLDHVLIQVSPT